MSSIFPGLHKSGQDYTSHQPLWSLLVLTFAFSPDGPSMSKVHICRPHPRGHGVIDLSAYFSLVLLTTMATPTSKHTEQFVLMATTGLVLSTTTLTLKLTDPSVFPWKGLIYPIPTSLSEKNKLTSKRQLGIQHARKQETVLFLVVYFYQTFSLILLL